MRKARLLMMIVLATLATTLQAEEATVSLHSTVSGNQEQPRVMYIVPWQQPAAAEFDYELHNGIAEELFAPIDRDEFVRELAYREILSASSDDIGNADEAGTTPQTLDNNVKRRSTP